MSGFENLKFSTVQYRPPDPMENLRFRVEIARLSEGRRAKKKKGGVRQDEAAAARARARAELGASVGTYEPPQQFKAEFKWQEKKFAKFNIPRYLGEEGKNAEPGSIRSVYRDHIMERIMQAQRVEEQEDENRMTDMELPSDISSPVYSYVEQDISENIAGEVADRFEYAREVANADTDMDAWMTRTTRGERKEIRELAATSELDIRFPRKNQLGKFIRNAFKLVTGEDPRESRELVGDGVPESMRRAPPKRMMVCFQAGAEDDSGHVDQLVLCYLNYHKSGLLEVRPGFGDKRYRVTALDGAVYEYSLIVTSENAASVMDKRRGRLYRDISRLQGARHSGGPPSKFTLPPFQASPGAPYPLNPDALRVYYNIEIVSCGNFVNASNLYVEWKVHVDRNVWGDLSEETEKNLQGTTHLVAMQTVYEPVEGSQSNVGTYVAHFSHPLELEMTSLEDPLGQYPVMSLAVMSYDSWDRSTTEGYAHLRLAPYSLGSHEVYVDTWRLEGSMREERDRFFIGGGPALSDISYVGGVPTWESRRVGRDGKEHASNLPLSRLGLRTVSEGGQIKLRINSIQHLNRPMEDFRPSNLDMSGLSLAEPSPRDGGGGKYVDHKAVIAKARMRLEDKGRMLKPKTDLSNQVEYPETKALPEPPAAEPERRSRRRRSSATPRRTPKPAPEPEPELEPAPEPVQEEDLPPPPEDLLTCMECMRTHDQDNMIVCVKCGCSYHMDCLPEPLTERPVEWTCENCRPAPALGHPCEECGLKVQPELQVQCAKCDRWYHLYCLSPPLSTMPEGRWECPRGHGCWAPSRVPTPPPPPEEVAPAQSRTPTPPLEEEEVEEEIPVPELPVVTPRRRGRAVGHRDIFYAIAKDLEVKELRMLDFFTKFDTHKDGKISKEELVSMVRTVVPDATNEEIRYFQVIMQRKPNEGIDYDAFSKGMRDAKSLGQIAPAHSDTILDCLYLAFLDLVDNRTGGNRKKLKELFNEVDKYQDGVLKRDEFRRLVVKVLPGATQSEVDKIIDNLNVVDTNADDQVDFEEFAKVVLDRHSQKAEKLHSDEHSGMRSDMNRLMRRRG